MLNGQGSSDGAGEQLFPNNNPDQVNEYLKEHDKPPPYAPQFYPTPSKEPYYPGDFSANQSPIPCYPYVQPPSPGARGPQEVIVLYNPPPVPPPPPPRSSYVWHIILSCVVFWCCGWMCGLVAFVLAICAQNSSSVGNGDAAKSYGKASIVLSIIGIAFGVIMIIVLVIVKNA